MHWRKGRPLQQQLLSLPHHKLLRHLQRQQHRPLRLRLAAALAAAVAVVEEAP